MSVTAAEVLAVPDEIVVADMGMGLALMMLEGDGSYLGSDEELPVQIEFAFGFASRCCCGYNAGERRVAPSVKSR